MAEAEEGMSARDRRRQAAKARSGSGAGKSLKKYRVHLVIALVFGGIVTAMVVNAQQGTSCPGHWHPTFDVFVNGERVSYASPKYDLGSSRSAGGSMAPSLHMHNQQGNDYTLHFEPSTPNTCLPFSDALRVIDTDLSSDRLVLDGDQSITGDFRANATHQVATYHKLAGADWKEIDVSDLLDRQPQPDERILIVYGNQTEEALAPLRQTAEAHPMTDSSGVGGKGSLVPAFGVGLLGVGLLAGWHALSKKA